MRRYFQEFDDDSSSDMERASLPTLSEVLYTPPNPNGMNKMCGNCVFYAYAQKRCFLHSPSLAIDTAAVCGYHVYSQVQRRVWLEAPNLQVVTPQQSGLVQTQGAGAACDNCEYYAAKEGENDGECMATVDGTGLPSLVEGKGCCARWNVRRETSVEEVFEIVEE